MKVPAGEIVPKQRIDTNSGLGVCATGNLDHKNLNGRIMTCEISRGVKSEFSFYGTNS